MYTARESEREVYIYTDMVMVWSESVKCWSKTERSVTTVEVGEKNDSWGFGKGLYTVLGPKI